MRDEFGLVSKSISPDLVVTEVNTIELVHCCSQILNDRYLVAPAKQEHVMLNENEKGQNLRSSSLSLMGLMYWPAPSIKSTVNLTILA